MNEAGGDELLLVPTLVPKPESLTVTQGNQFRYESAANRLIGLRWVTYGHETCSLKIHVSFKMTLCGHPMAHPFVAGSIDGTAAALPRLRRLSTGFAGLGAGRPKSIFTLTLAPFGPTRIITRLRLRTRPALHNLPVGI